MSVRILRPGQKILTIGNHGLSVISPRGGAAATYISKVLGYSPIAYWPLNEGSGAGAAICQVDTDQNGTPTDATFGNALGPDGVNYAPSFNGTSSRINIDTAALEAVFNGDEGTISIWIKVSGSGVWTDSAYREVISLYGDSSNAVRINKGNTNNTMRFLREANNTVLYYNATMSPTDWAHIGLSWSVSGGKLKTYLNGSEIVGSEKDIATTWAVSTFVNANIGSLSTSYLWSGWLAHVAVFDSALSDAAILALATV